MWTINNKIFERAQKGTKNKVIVSVPDFEGQFLGYLQNGDKPYNALKELADESKGEIKTELRNILYDTISQC